MEGPVHTMCSGVSRLLVVTALIAPLLASPTSMPAASATAGHGILVVGDNALARGFAVPTGETLARATFSRVRLVNARRPLPPPRPRVPPPPGGRPPSFVDVADSVFAPDIAWLTSVGITRGCNPPHNDRFCPDDPITRGQMAAFLTRALGLPPADNRFGDDDGSPFEADINALGAAGITRGCNSPHNDRFCADALVTRDQMAAFLVRAYRLPAGRSRFRDAHVSLFAADIEALAHAGITLGCNPPRHDRFCPGDPVTRGQMAAFLHRAQIPVLRPDAPEDSSSGATTNGVRQGGTHPGDVCGVGVCDAAS